MSEASNEDKISDNLAEHLGVQDSVSAEAPAPDLDHVLSWAEIEEIDDTTEEKVQVPQWGGSVVIRSISHRQMNKLKQESEADTDGAPAEEKLQKYLLMHAMTSPNIDSIEQVEVLWNKSTAAIMTILLAVMENSKLSTKSLKAAERQFSEGQQ